MNFVEMGCLSSRKNLANESLRNCDVRQVLFILIIFYRFKPKNVCIFQLFQREIILVKFCKDVMVLLELVFFEFSAFKCEYFFAYIVRTD